LIGAMLNQKGAIGKAKPAPNFATDSAREEFCAPVKLGLSVYGLSVTEALRVLPNSALPKPADNIGAPQ
jgi:hypothetical protein